MEHVLKHVGEVPGHAGHCRIRIAERNHAGSEMNAVLVDETLAVALEIAFTLQAFIKIGSISGGARRYAGILDLDPLAKFDAGVLGSSAHPILAPDQDGAAQPLMHEACG